MVADDLLFQDGDGPEAEDAEMIVLDPLPIPYNRRPRPEIKLRPDRPPVGGLWPFQVKRVAAIRKQSPADVARGIEDRETFVAAVGHMVEVCEGERFPVATPYTTPETRKGPLKTVLHKQDNVETIWRGILAEPCMARVDENGVVWAHTGPVRLVEADSYRLDTTPDGGPWRPTARGQAVAIPAERIVLVRMPSPQDLRFWEEDQRRNRRAKK